MKIAEARIVNPLRPFAPQGLWSTVAGNLFGGQTMRRNVQHSLIVNGETLEASFAPYKTLLEVLREDLGLTGTKHGCELGECGAYAVLVDGAPQLSCLILAVESEGRAIETVEGLAESWKSGATLHPLQTAFADLG